MKVGKVGGTVKSRTWRGSSDIGAGGGVRQSKEDGGAEAGADAPKLPYLRERKTVVGRMWLAVFQQAPCPEMGSSLPTRPLRSSALMQTISSCSRCPRVIILSQSVSRAPITGGNVSHQPRAPLQFSSCLPCTTVQPISRYLHVLLRPSDDMAPPSWATDEQWNWLIDKGVGYREAQKTSQTTPFFAGVWHDWFVEYLEEDSVWGKGEWQKPFSLEQTEELTAAKEARKSVSHICSSRMHSTRFHRRDLSHSIVQRELTRSSSRS